MELFAVNIFNVHDVVMHGGLILISLLIFAESGMMIGVFFPGDTLLFSAGILAASGQLPIAGVLICVAIAAILGDNIGYLIGKSTGHRLFKKEAVVFRQDYIDRATAFFAKYGNQAMLFAHFVPIVRTFAPVTAGAAKMNHKQFFVFDAIGDIAWTLVITLLGYFVGSRVPGIEKLIDPFIALVVIAVFGLTAVHTLRDPFVRASLKKKFNRKK